MKNVTIIRTDDTVSVEFTTDRYICVPWETPEYFNGEIPADYVLIKEKQVACGLEDKDAWLYNLGKLEDVVKCVFGTPEALTRIDAEDGYGRANGSRHKIDPATGLFVGGAITDDGYDIDWAVPEGYVLYDITGYDHDSEYMKYYETSVTFLFGTLKMLCAATPNCTFIPAQEA